MSELEVGNASNIKLNSIRLLIKKAEEFHTLAMEIGIDTGLIEAIAGSSVIVEPSFIVELVERKLNVQVKFNNRKKETVEARRIIAWLLRKYSRLSLQKIMLYVNLKDHSTVLHHLKTMNGFLEHDEYLQHLTHSLEEDILNYYTKKSEKW
jgi:chromosomal replication initiation ATPase DnaA